MKSEAKQHEIRGLTKRGKLNNMKSEAKQH